MIERHIQTACLVILAIPHLATLWRKCGNWAKRQRLHWEHVRSKLDA